MSQAPQTPFTPTTADAHTGEQPIHIVPRELSWLAFNERVLQEAADSNNPVVERMRFLGIFSNNMDEFFRVRVADVRRRILFPHLEYESSDDGVDDAQLLHDIQDKVFRLNKRFDKLYKEVSRELKANKISILTAHTDLSEDQSRWLKGYMKSEALPYICPIIVHAGMDLPALLSDDAFYLAVEMLSDDGVEHAVVEVPTKETSRFILLPNNARERQFLLLDDAMKHCLNDIFGAVFTYSEIRAYSFKMTRDAELNLGGDIDQSVLDKMSRGLRRRLTAEPVRLVYDQDMPQSMLDFLAKRLKFTSHDSIVPSGPYRNFRDFIGFPNVGGKSLEHRKLPAIRSAAFDSFDNALDAIAHEDILLYYPYHSFGYFTELLRQAAFDPRVQKITINIYRVAKNSRVLHSLCDAARNGKKVTVVVELQARFDEHNNIELSKQLESVGINVAFGIPTLKVHSKLCLIERKEGGQLKRYAHIGTGNFHEGNARIYTDYSYFTAHEEITREVAQVFEFIHRSYKPYQFNHLMVSPINCREKISQLIEDEIAAATAGKAASIHIKANNLCDNGIARLLCKASNAGVEVKMIVRGMCSLRTEDPGISDRIEVHSIVDQFLEHARVMIFGNQGDPLVYITSADLMKRNIEHRVEVGVPIYDRHLRRQILEIFDLQMKDNCKARRLDYNQTNPYVDLPGRRIRSQIAIHQYLSRIENQNRDTDFD
ncbi:polyphosphate kinase 1 [Pseudomaricurvus sp. HS19]|uniref:polyphosphate kinase 1 n=1 Tax=Pseudomaricurvus sp. HS19 TaxID=2692626 RepID=UPI00136AF250|nr:polyphosphate kinase 1 [Pseudomaricurvus sp. HS19]MYM64307.1 polyphosphate kinase 1 [Pseudomaricurvus sp. HS19]